MSTVSRSLARVLMGPELSLVGLAIGLGVMANYACTPEQQPFDAAAAHAGLKDCPEGPMRPWHHHRLADGGYECRITDGPGGPVLRRTFYRTHAAPFGQE